MEDAGVFGATDARATVTGADQHDADLLLIVPTTDETRMVKAALLLHGYQFSRGGLRWTNHTKNGKGE